MKGKKSSSAPPHFFQLPDTVVDNLLDFLRPSDLCKLREVCLTCKSWVETRTKTLRRIPITINIEEGKADDQAEEFLKTNARWSNISLYLRSTHRPLPTFMPYIRRILDFVEPDLKQIKITLMDKEDKEDSMETTDLMEIMLRLPPTLESLCFEDYLYPGKENVVEHPDFDIPAESIPILQEKLKRLTKVEFGHMLSYYPYGVRFLQRLILTNAPNLQWIKLPFDPLDVFFIEDVETNEEREIYIPGCLPVLLEFVRGLGHTCRPLSKPRVTIEFLPRWFVVRDYYIETAQSELAELVEDCHYQKGNGREIILLNVPHVGLPRRDVDLTNQLSNKLNTVVKSVVLSNLQRSANPPYIPSNASVMVSNDVVLEADGSLPLPPLDLSITLNITEVRLGCMSREMSLLANLPPEEEQLFYRNLLGQIRPTVTDLTIANYDFFNLEPIALGRVFPNLKNLKVIGLDLSHPNMADLLGGLDQLETLSFEKCNLKELTPSIDQKRGGKYLPLVLLLKSLRTLKLKDCSLGAISLDTFKDALTYMIFEKYYFEELQIGGEWKRFYIKIVDDRKDGTLYKIRPSWKERVDDMICVVPPGLNLKDIEDFYVKTYGVKQRSKNKKGNKSSRKISKDSPSIPSRVTGLILGIMAKIF